MSINIDEAIADSNTYTNQSIYDEMFRAIRREEPVRWTTPADTRPFWIVSKHADIVEVERQANLFINAPRTELLTIPEEAKLKAATGMDSAQRTLLHMDGREHLTYRQLAQGWFMPRNLRKLETDLAQLAREHVDRMQECGGRCDFVNDVSVWFPLRVIMMILGIPKEDAAELLRLTRNYVGRRDEGVVQSRGRDESGLEASREVFDYFRVILNERRRSPRDDLASVIANAEIDGQPIKELEALSYYLLLGLAGHETTASTISGGLLALIQNPAELAKLRAQPDLVGPATDEMLRWSTPTRHFFKTAVSSYSLRGKSIEAGHSLMMCYPSANRDEEVYDDPFTFKVDRTPNPHLSFGYGPHVCVGQHLAKMEIRAFFKELISRLEHIELTAEPQWLGTVFAGGLKNLPIRFRMRRFSESA